MRTNTAQLTAPGVTQGFQAGYNSVNHSVQVVVSNINTNVVLRIEGSLDGTNWFNLDDTDTSTTITANGVYCFMAIGKLHSIRLNFVSESGGPAAVIDATYLG